MSSTPLELLLNKVKSMCVDAAQDGKIELNEVLAIAFVALKGIVAFSGLSIPEKKGLLLLSLQRGLSSAGSLKGFDHINSSLTAELEKQALNLATQAAFAAFDAVPQAFQIGETLSYVRQLLSKYLPFCSQGAQILSTIDPKDSGLIAEALEALRSVESALQVRTVESTQVSQAAPVAVAVAVVAAAPVAVAAAAAPVVPVVPVVPEVVALD